MDKRLRKAAYEGDINVLYTLIKECTKVLEGYDEVSLVDNPLHVAASQGRIHFAAEIMRLKPSFARKLNQDGLSPLHLALQHGETGMVFRLIDIDRDLIRVPGREGMTPLHHVAKEGDLKLLPIFLSACPKSFEDVTMRNETALHIALKHDKFEAFEILLIWLAVVCYEEYQFEKRILNWRDEDGNTALHIATSRNQPRLVSLLLRSNADVNSKNFAGLTALDMLEHQRMTDEKEIRAMLFGVGAMRGAILPIDAPFKHYLRTDQKLKIAAQNGDIDALYEVIQEDPCILDRIDRIAFIDNPMHIAASAGHTNFALEIMMLKPTFSRKQNQHGFSPMHLALRNGNNQTVLRLISVDRNLVRVKGREAKTPLHCVAEMGDVDILAEFLAACPESIRDLTIQNETAIHVAIKNDHSGAVEVLLGWLEHVDMDVVLEWTDDEGNTALHVAIYRKQFQVIKLLMNRININAKNSKGLTALDISKLQGPASDTDIWNLLHQNGALGASSLPEGATLADFLRTRMSVLEKWITSTYLSKCCMSNENRNALLVVAVLIATSTFQAVLSPPGGVRQGVGFNSNPTTNSTTSDELDRRSLFAFNYMARWICFLAFNTVAFLASVSEIWFHLPKGLYFSLKFVLPLLLCYMLSLSLTMPVSHLMPLFLMLLLLSQWKSVARLIFFKRSLEFKPHLLKHCSNLHKELKEQITTP